MIYDFVSKWRFEIARVFEMIYDCRFEMTAQNFRQQDYFGQRASWKFADEKYIPGSLRTNPRMWKEETAWKRMPVFWPSTKRKSSKRNCVKDATKDGHQRLYAVATALTASSAMWANRWWMRPGKLRKTAWMPSRKSAPKYKCKCTRKDS